jgi:hypothetical protein
MALANGDGETIELVNAARVKAYTDNLAPSMGLRGCEDCDGLEAAVGSPDGYTTPEGDNAPWYDPTDPVTGDFYGVYPLGFAGIDDSTRSIESAELTGDGSVVVGSRFTGKDIRVNGVAFAKDEAALYAGMSWLDSALNGTEEGRCFGDRLNVFSSCPPVQVLPPDFAEPYTLEVPVTQAELDAWTTSSGTITAWPGGGSLPDPGLRFDWNPGDPQKLACREITGLIPGEQYQLRMRIENFGDFYVRIADSCAESRTNLAPNPRLLGWEFAGGGVTDSEADIPTGGPLGLGYRQSITTSSNTSSPYGISALGAVGVNDSIPVTAGNLYQGSIYLRAPVGTARLSSRFFNSGGGQIGTEVILRSGVGMNNTWQRLEGIVVAPESAVSMEIFAAWTVGVGAIQPNMEFGAANLLVESPGYDILRTNLHTDSRAEQTNVWDFALGADGVVTPSAVAGAVDGPVLYGSVQSPTYNRNEVTTAPTSGTAGPFTSIVSSFMGISDYPDPLLTGTPWVTGAFFRSNRAVTGTARHQVFAAGEVLLEEVVEPFSLDADTWLYVAGGQNAQSDLVGVEEMRVILEVGGAGGGAAVQVGDIYDATGGIVLVGSSDESYFDSQRPTANPLAYLVFGLQTAQDGSIEVEVEDVGTYFDGNFEGYRWDGTPNASSSSLEQEIDYETVSGWSEDPPTETTVLDFIPRTDSVHLSLTPTQTSPSVPTTALLIYSALVRRVPRPGVVAFGSGHNVVPPSDGWTHLAPDTMSVEWIYGEAVEFSMVWTIGQAPFESALTYTPDHGVERTVFGMIPASRYRLMIQFDATWSETDVSGGQDINPFASVGTGTGAVATYTVDNGSAHFWVIEFTAAETSTVIGLHPNANLELGSFGSVSWQIDQYMVEEILETDATEPDPGRFQARTMYQVKASQGPILTNLRRASCGVMAEITYSLRAGNPFKYRNPIFAGGLPTGTSVTIPDVPCSEDGLPQIINFSYDPSLEAVVPADPSWAGGGANLTFNDRVMSPTARLGEWVYRITADAGGSLAVVNNYYFPSEVTSGPLPIGGDTLTVSAYVRATTSGTLGVFEMNCFVTMTGHPSFSSGDTVNVAVVGQWYRLETTFTLPDNVTLSGIESGFFPPDDVAAAVGMEVDALMIQRGDVATEPFDQTTPNTEWSGDPNQSALLLTPLAEDVSEDPECPAPPAPPAPPQVANACVTEPSSYNRTVVSVPADTVPRNLTAYPVITLIAGTAPVRQARIRFWENPDNLTIDQLGPCDYDGEIIVSYLAEGATIVINGVLREATVSKPGFVDQDGNHLLYGPDGGPVEWPELTGGIPYLVTLELDSGEAYTDTLMLVDLVVRD